jgi:protein-S-isoprenylcysteine O-methyltransferase Ste14
LPDSFSAVQRQRASDTIGAIAANLVLALKIAWAIFLIVWVIGAFTSKRTARRQSWKSRFGMVGIAALEYFLLSTAAQYLGFAERRFLPDSLLWLQIGLFITVAGLLFATWARVTLGRNWSGIVTVKQNHELIRTGPYALVRHPIYTGVVFAIFGTAIFDGKIRAIILLAVVLSILIHKMKIEEQFMTEQFGSEYTSYRRSTKALFPLIW